MAENRIDDFEGRTELIGPNEDGSFLLTIDPNDERPAYRCVIDRNFAEMISAYIRDGLERLSQDGIGATIGRA